MQSAATLITSFLLVLAAGAAQARPDSSYTMGPVGFFTPEAGEDANFVSFSSGYLIDTRVGEPEIPARLKLVPSEAGPRYHIVQFIGPLRRHWLDELRRLGAEPVGYLPSYAVLAKLDARTRDAVAALSMVRWVGLFQPAYKIEPGLLDTEGTFKVVCLLMPGENPDALAQLAAGPSAVVDRIQTTNFGTTVEATLDANDIPLVAGLQEVLWIERQREVEACNVDAQWVSQTGWRSSAPAPTDTAARRVWTRGVRGQRTVLSITDTGTNMGHDLFRDPGMSVTPPGIWPNHRKVVAFKLYQGASAGESPFHGSHVNGTVAGDDSATGGTSNYDGMSIKGRLYFVDLTSSSGGFVIGSDLTPLWDTVYLGRGLPDSLRPIKQHSGSWRAYNYSGTYTIMEASTDAYCWAHKDFLNIMAAGNEGPGARTIGNPSLAKDIITVGATSNGTGSNSLAGFSSRGPSQDNRIKPNVCAPGVNLWSAYYTGTNTYIQASGTSMATPTVNGATGLVRCYLQEGYYPTGTPQVGDRRSYISSALLRSMVMASADPNIGSYVVPSFDIGWGRIDVDSVLYFAGDTRRLMIRDDTAGLATGQYKRLQFTVNSAIPLRVVAAWTDTAAAPNANPTLVNDLNLELTAPGGTQYRGNQYSGGQSQANPTVWDNRNTEECARINAPATGVWTLRVLANQVSTGARQPFAVTVTGDVNPYDPDAGVTVIAVPTGTIDSTQSVTPACSVYNWGNTTASYTVRMRIGSGYNNTSPVSGHTPGTRRLVTFPQASAWPRGSLAIACSTELTNDTAPGNDRQTSSVSVRVLDALASAITSPPAQVDSGANIVPQAMVLNNGTQSATFNVTLGIGGTYNSTQTVSGLAPGASTPVNFAPWTAGARGSFNVACTTRLAGDMVPANNIAGSTVSVAVHDIAAVAVIAPSGQLVPGASVTPQATCRNHGSLREACKVLFRINCLPPYSDSLMLTAGLPAADTALSFATWTALSGGHTATCSTHLATDQIAANNVAAKAFVVGDPGWTQKNSMPGPPSAKPVKDGGWLAYDAGQGHIYGAKGNKTGDFYSYSPPTDSWRQLELWPLGAEAKPPSKGSVGCADGNGRIYAVKGNNTQGFWMYDAGSNTWTQKANIPLGLTNKKVKGGAGIVWAYKGGIGYPYLLKGYKNEFWRYHTAGDSWHALPEAAVGANLKWDKGSWLAYDGASGIYAHKAKYHEFYRYDTEEDSWGPPLQAMPIPGSAGAKKSKDGGSGAYAAGSIFAFKGGNTQEFWRYSVAGNAWTEKETLPMGPSGKKVKAGAGLVAVSSVLYALKGNKTSEFWMYIPGAFSFTPYASRPTVQELTLMPYASCVMRVSPNPLTTGFATLSITGAPEHLGAGARSISVLDISGRVVLSRALGVGRQALSVALDLRSTPAGVYVVRLDGRGLSVRQKLVIQR